MYVNARYALGKLHPEHDTHELPRNRQAMRCPRARGGVALTSAQPGFHDVAQMENRT